MAISEVDSVPMMASRPTPVPGTPTAEYEKWTVPNMERIFSEAARNGWAAKETAECLASGGVDISAVHGPGYDILRADIDQDSPS
jgi:hypothetical protein